MDWYTLGVAMFAAIGTFLFGFDTGIATTTIAHQSWVDYMDKPSKAQVGAVSFQPRKFRLLSLTYLDRSSLFTSLVKQLAPSFKSSQEIDSVVFDSCKLCV